MMTGSQFGAVLTAVSLAGAVLAPSTTIADVARTDHLRPMALPAIEALTRDSDFTVFMAPEMPAEIRKQALRRLWRLLVSQSDGLGTYEADYATFLPVRRAAAAGDAVESPRTARR